MTPAGWAIMLVSTVGMTVFFLWCIWKVLATPGESDRVHSPADLDPGDQDT